MLQTLQTEIDMVNAMLSIIEESPIQTIDLTHPDVKLALELWNETSLEVQAHGWWYNQEEYQLTPDAATYEVFLPGGTLGIDAPGLTYVRRGRLLYDTENHSYNFEDALSDDLLIMCTIGWELEDLPITVYNYIKAITKAKMLNERAFDAGIIQGLQNNIYSAKVLLDIQHLKYSDSNAKSRTTAAALLQQQPQR